MEFYGAAAQVIPVLFLALVFEDRLLSREPTSYDVARPEEARYWNASQIVGRIYFTLLIAAGQVAALIGLYRQVRTPLTDDVVWLGLAAALMALVGSVLDHQLGHFRKWWSSEGRAGWAAPALVLAGLIVLTIQAMYYFH